MGNSGLTASSPLGGYEHMFDDTRVREIVDLAIVSLSVPQDGIAALNAALHTHWQRNFPQPGECVQINDIDNAVLPSAFFLCGLQSDQCFVVMPCQENSTQQLVDHIHELLGSVAYLTDQSDSWAVLDIEGNLTMAALERICMLDLPGMTTPYVARTSMEHLPVIVQKQGEEHVRLYSPRSSALSFLHTITTSLQNVTAAQ